MEKVSKDQQEKFTWEEITEMSIPHTIHIGDFEEDALLEFTRDINEAKEYLRKDVYINSRGGYVNMIAPMKDMLESNKANLIATTNIYSAGFILFFTTKVNREILDGTLGMFHYPFLPMAKLLPDNRVDTRDSKLMELEMKLRIPYEEYLKELLGITKTKHKALLKGEEMVYETKELRKLLEKSNKMLDI